MDTDSIEEVFDSLFQAGEEFLKARQERAEWLKAVDEFWAGVREKKEKINNDNNKEVVC